MVNCLNVVTGPLRGLFGNATTESCEERFESYLNFWMSSIDFFLLCHIICLFLLDFIYFPLIKSGE